jgi:hypothetical protein
MQYRFHLDADRRCTDQTASMPDDGDATMVAA